MEKFAFYIGMDVSKNTLDVHCSEVNKHITIPNSSEGIRMFHSCCRENGIDLKNAFVTLPNSNFLPLHAADYNSTS